MNAFAEEEQHWAGGRRPSMRPPARIESRVVLVIVAALVGFLVAIQATGGDRLERLEAETPEALTRILADLNAEADTLSRRISQLRVRLERYRTSSESDDLVLRDAREQLADLEVLAGVVPVTGPGIAVTLEDPEAVVSWDAMLDLVQELRDAGAEAIAVNGMRVVASTWFGPAGRGIEIDGQPASPPFEIEAIGPAEQMSEALEIPGGPLTLIRARPGVEVRIRDAGGLDLPAAG